MIEPLPQNKPNRLMQAMIAVSVLVHVVLLIYLSGMYRFESLTVIELSMKDMFRPVGRAIPRPRMRPHAPTITEPALPRQNIPRFVMPTEDRALPSSLMESISAPAPSADMMEGLSGLFAGDGQGLFSKKDYYNMIRMNIENAKSYPESARSRMIEGRVTVRFTITSDGQVSALSIIRFSGNPALDQAAMSAVQDAAPFARPPATLFKGPLHMELTLTFELT